MPEPRVNVPLPMPLPTQKSLRAAVADIIRDIQRDHAETDQCTSDRLGISIGTVRNARNEAADLNALYGATAQPRQHGDIDPLADLARAVATICDMRRENSQGGHVETPKERLDAMPALKAARAALDSYIAGIEKLRAVA